MIEFTSGVIVGSGMTLALYSILVGKRIQEEQDKACKCIFKYEEYRRRIRTLEYQKKELEKRIEDIKNFDYDFTNEVKNGLHDVE